MEVKQIDKGQNGIFYIEIEHVKVAEMTYTHSKPNKLIINHTEVDDSFKGQGIGYKLIEAAVAYMRTNNLKVIPLCPYADAVFKKNHDVYIDVLV